MTRTIEEILEKEGVYVSNTKGISMLPTLKEGRDAVVILPCTERLKKYDVALYRRGNDYVLHRVIKVLPDSYVCRGDNCLSREYGITDANIIGKLAECHRRNRRISTDSLSFKLGSRMVVLCHPAISLTRKVKARLTKNKKGGI
jgi:hypothetical protein